MQFCDAGMNLDGYSTVTDHYVFLCGRLPEASSSRMSGLENEARDQKCTCTYRCLHARHCAPVPRRLNGVTMYAVSPPVKHSVFLVPGYSYHVPLIHSHRATLAKFQAGIGTLSHGQNWQNLVGIPFGIGIHSVEPRGVQQQFRPQHSTVWRAVPDKTTPATYRHGNGCWFVSSDCTVIMPRFGQICFNGNAVQHPVHNETVNNGSIPPPVIHMLVCSPESLV